jgi:hypothetical protein
VLPLHNAQGPAHGLHSFTLDSPQFPPWHVVTQEVPSKNLPIKQLEHKAAPPTHFLQTVQGKHL